MKRKKCSLSMLILLVLTCREVYSHCHTGEPEEDGMRDLITYRRWNEPGVVETVYYHIGLYDMPGLPSLANGDVTYASAQWSDIDHKGHTVKFRLNAGVRLSRTPGIEDGVNYVDWGLTDAQDNPGYTWIFADPTNGNRVKECDTAFNYYLKWAAHYENSTTKYCLRNVATHEFGHWLVLRDVSGWTSPAYFRYTMNNDRRKGYDPNAPMYVHYQESLECEDKWGAWYMYNVLPDPAPPITQMPSLDIALQVRGDVYC